MTVHQFVAPHAKTLPAWTLREEFEGQAEWRRTKAEEYPDDDRNNTAAQIFDKLAATADAIPQALLLEYAGLELSDDMMLWSEHLRAVGFHEFPDDATEFLKNFIEEFTDRRALIAS